jgi:hypothetical protein
MDRVRFFEAVGRRGWQGVGSASKNSVKDFAQPAVSFIHFFCHGYAPQVSVKKVITVAFCFSYNSHHQIKFHFE